MALTGLTNLQPLHIKTVGIGTFDNTVSVGGTLTYEDVTNVDAIGIITARSGVNVSGGQLDVGSNIKLGNAGVITATSFVGSGSGLTGLNSDLVNDTSPQLGGALDVNGNNIQSGNAIYQIIFNQRHRFYSGGNQIIDINGNGVDFLHGNNTHADNVKSQFGTSNDLQIYHTGSASWVYDNGTGPLYIGTNNSNIEINGGGSANDTMAKFKSTEGVELFYNNSLKFDTTTTGVRVHGDEGGTAQLQLLADQGDDDPDYWRFIAETNGVLNIQDYGSGNWYNNIRLTGSTGGVELYHDNTKALETHANGIKSIMAGATRITFGSTNAGGCMLVLDGDSDGDGSGNDYAYIQHDTFGRLRIENYKSQSIKFGTAGVDRWDIQSDGHIVPQANGSYDIGTSSYRARNIYTNDLNLSNKGSTNSVDNTWGDYTIQEGESDLFLINNRSGKKYKFNLTEVN